MAAHKRSPTRDDHTRRANFQDAGQHKSRASAKSTSDERATAEEIFHPYKPHVPPWLRRELFDGIPKAGKRSDMLWKMEHTLIDAGMSSDDAFKCLRVSPWNKFKGRDEQLRHELDKVLSEKLVGGPEIGSLDGQWDGERPPPPPEWLVRHLIMRRGIGILSGKWGTGKTYIAIDLAAALGSRQPFAGKKVSQRCGVLYLAAERSHTILRRLSLARECRSIEGFLPFFLAGSCPTLTAPDAFHTLAATAYDVAAEMRRRHGVRLGLIVIDTLMVAAGWTNENDPAEVQSVMKVLRALSDETGTFVLAIDHHGKDASRGTRGSSDKEASSDVVISLVPGEMTLAKCSEGPQGLKRSFRLDAREIGSYEDGEPVTECTVDWCDELPKQFRSLSSLRAAIASVPEQTVANKVAVPKAAVRKAFDESSGSKSAEARRMAWMRAYNAAVTAGEVSEVTQAGELFIVLKDRNAREQA